MLAVSDFQVLYTLQSWESFRTTRPHLVALALISLSNCCFQSFAAAEPDTSVSSLSMNWTQYLNDDSVNPIEQPLILDFSPVQVDQPWRTMACTLQNSTYTLHMVSKTGYQLLIRRWLEERFLNEDHSSILIDYRFMRRLLSLNQLRWAIPIHAFFPGTSAKPTVLLLIH